MSSVKCSQELVFPTLSSVKCSQELVLPTRNTVKCSQELVLPTMSSVKCSQELVLSASWDRKLSAPSQSFRLELSPSPAPSYTLASVHLPSAITYNKSKLYCPISTNTYDIKIYMTSWRDSGKKDRETIIKFKKKTLILFRIRYINQLDKTKAELCLPIQKHERKKKIYISKSA